MTHSDTTTRTSDEITVLMTGAGAPGASGIVKSLRATDEREVEIVGVDVNPDAYGFALVDTAETVPAGEADDYVPRMVEIADREGVDVVLPLTTAELEPLAAARDRFDATVTVSPADALSIANDKGRLYEFLADAGFDATPEYRRVDTAAGFQRAVADLGYPDDPVCFKPPVASGMRGFRVLDAETDRLTRLLEEKPDSTVTTLDDVLPVLSAAETFPELAVMEYLPGAEYSVDLLAMGDEVGPVVPRSRARTRAGITFEGTVEENEDLIAAATAISEALGLRYNVNVQFKYDAAGDPKVLEINPRVAGTIVMCVGAGVNLPYLGVKHALGEEIDPSGVEWGTEMVRYWQELFHGPEGRPFHLDPERERRPPHPSR